MMTGSGMDLYNGAFRFLIEGRNRDGFEKAK